MNDHRMLVAKDLAMTSSHTRRTALSEPFRRSSISFAGMLMCVFASALALMSVSADQTGTTAAVVSQSFADSIQQAAKVPSSTIPSESSSSDPGSQIFRFASARMKAKQNEEFPGRKFRDEEELFSLEDENRDSANSPRDEEGNVNIDRSGFPHFIQELKRYRNVSEVRSASAHQTVDFIATERMTLDEKSEQLATFISTICEGMESEGQKPESVTFRVFIWSPSPVFTVLASTTEEAQQLEESVRPRLAERQPGNVSVIVESAAWMSPNSPRPEMSVRAEF